MRRPNSYALPIFILAFAIRSIAAVVTTVTDLNPDSQADAAGFGNTAEEIARGILQGQPYQFTTESIDISQVIFPLTSADIYTLWGSFLAPFWMIPGPSSFYARLWTALLGSLAIYNVYIIARNYHSHQAGVIAVLPMIFYPSFVAIHSTLLREAMILFGITTAGRLLIVSSEYRLRVWSYFLAALMLHVALLLRDDNFIIYSVAIATAIGVYIIESGYLSKRIIATGFLLFPVVYITFLPIIRHGIDFLAYIRRVRASGRTLYLPEVIPNSITELVAFSWIGAAYFLYAPFPWMIETIPDLLVSFEGLITLGFSFAGFWGVRTLYHKGRPATIGLLVGLAVAVVLYGIGTVNYGTGMRHRQMFIWVIFLFGAIGISEYIKIPWPLQTHLSSVSDSNPGTDRQ